jgi:hypothetical protein
MCEWRSPEYGRPEVDALIDTFTETPPGATETSATQFRDQPDVLVPLATILELVTAITVFGFSLLSRQQSELPGTGH